MIATKAKRKLLRNARALGFVNDGLPDRSIGVAFLKCERRGRVLKLQIWDQGAHRVSHGTITHLPNGQKGCIENTRPTEFFDMLGMFQAIAYEWQR